MIRPTGGLFLFLESESIYVFESILNPSHFLRALPHLLSPSDKIIFGIYNSNQTVLDFFERNSLPSDPIIDSWDEIVKTYKDDDDCPNPMACAIPADPKLLFELANIASSLKRAYELCIHLGAYSKDKALISFHDAFQSDPCHVSGDIPKEKMDRFADEIDISYKIATNDEIYPFLKSKNG